MDSLLPNTQARMSCTLSLRHIQENQHFLNFFGRVPFLSFAQKKEWRFSHCPFVTAVLHWKVLFSVLPLGYIMTPFFLLLSEINVELTECVDMTSMLRPVSVLVFFAQLEWMHSSPYQHNTFYQRRTYHYSCRLAQPFQTYQSQEKRTRSSVTEEQLLASHSPTQRWSLGRPHCVL